MKSPASIFNSHQQPKREVLVIASPDRVSTNANGSTRRSSLLPSKTVIRQEYIMIRTTKASSTPAVAMRFYRHISCFHDLTDFQTSVAQEAVKAQGQEDRSLSLEVQVGYTREWILTKRQTRRNQGERARKRFGYSPDSLLHNRNTKKTSTYETTSEYRKLWIDLFDLLKLAMTHEPHFLPPEGHLVTCQAQQDVLRQDQ